MEFGVLFAVEIARAIINSFADSKGSDGLYQDIMEGKFSLLSKQSFGSTVNKGSAQIKR